MIRIDLGKGAGKKGSAKKSTPAFTLPAALKIPTVKLDFKVGVLVAIASAFACLPHLFVNQYRSYLESQHQLVLKTLQAEDEKLRQDIARFQTFQKEMESYEEQKKRVRERLEVVRQLLSLRATPVNILDAIGQSLPQRVWLGAMDLTLTGTPQLSLAGKSFSGEEISDFVDRLGESIYLADVTLDGVTTQKEEGGEVKSFQVFATPKGLPSSNTRAVAGNVAPGTPGVPPRPPVNGEVQGALAPKNNSAGVTP